MKAENNKNKQKLQPATQPLLWTQIAYARGTCIYKKGENGIYFYIFIYTIHVLVCVVGTQYKNKPLNNEEKSNKWQVWKTRNALNTELPKLFCRLVNMMQQILHAAVAFTLALWLHSTELHWTSHYWREPFSTPSTFCSGHRWWAVHNLHRGSMWPLH